MSRHFVVVLAIAAAALSATAHAQSYGREDRAMVAYAPSDLTNASAFDHLQQRVRARADAYCRANPLGGTVAACRAEVAQSMIAQLQAQRAAAMSARRDFAQQSH